MPRKSNKEPLSGSLEIQEAPENASKKYKAVVLRDFHYQMNGGHRNYYVTFKAYQEIHDENLIFKMEKSSLPIKLVEI